MKHSLLLLLVAASAATLASCHQKPAESAAHSSPSAACQAALAPGGHAQPTDRAIADLQERARQSPWKRDDALEQLGYKFVARARAANDPGDYTLAERVATCLEEQQPGNPAALLLRGHALHQLHRFREAEAIARTLVTKREFVLDYALLGDALMEQGRLDEAEEFLRASDASAEQLESISHRAAAWMARGDLAAKRGEDGAAAKLYRQAAEALQDVRF
jgi:tetratricopeptide (TPR) repeat protein